MKTFSFLTRWILLVVLTAAWQTVVSAAIPPAERLLPADTLLVLSAPDASGLGNSYKASHISQFLNDPAMRPIREKFLAKWKEEFVSPLERELGVRFDDYRELLQGQITFAVIQNGWQGQEGQEPAALVLLDSRDKSEQLKKTLSELRRKWVDGGKSLRTETVRGVELWIVKMSSNSMPATLQKFFPQWQEIQEKGRENKPKSDSPSEFVIAQHESLLIAGTSQKAVETVVARVTGGTAPALADEAVFQANQSALLRDVQIYGWFNSKRLFDVLLSLPPAEPNPEAPSPFPPMDVGKIIKGSGFGGIKSIVAAWRSGRDGARLDLYIGAPESERVGITKLLATSAKDSSPPPFVPADVMTFQRWRLDGQGAIATLEKMIGEMFPTALGVLNFIISTANTAGSQNNPGFDVRKDVFGNLGDDLVSYSKPPRGTTQEDLASPPSILLIGSHNAEKLAASLQGILAIVSLSAPTEREFIGKKIHTVGVARNFMGIQTFSKGTLSYAASGGYVALTTDVSLLEEYLRSGETPPKPLRELPGLADAAQKIGGQSTGLFSYENQSEKMRLTFKVLKEGTETSRSGPGNVISGSIPYASPEKSFKDWLDFSLLPDFDRVAKYFHYGIETGGTSPEGITYRWIYPTPPQLRE